MKNKIVTLIICLLLGMSLSACGEQVNEEKDKTEEIPTVSMEAETEDAHMESVIEEESGQDEVEENHDNSLEYQVLDDKDIIYNNTRFVGLYTVLTTIDSKYDIDTLLNFIAKTYAVNADIIYSSCFVDYVDRYNDEQRTIDEQLSEYNGYLDIKSEYNNAPAKWQITLTDETKTQRVMLFGRYDYVLTISTHDNINFDIEILNEEIEMSYNDNTANENESGLESELASAYMQLVNMHENQEQDCQISYNLVYANDDDIPDLLVDYPSYWLNLYTYVDGQLYTIMEHQDYGTWGRSYCYIEREGRISTPCFSIEGDQQVNYDEVYQINSDYKLEEVYYYPEILAQKWSEGNEWSYYLGEEEITEEKYGELLGTGYQALQGKYSAEEMREQLQ